MKAKGENMLEVTRLYKMKKGKEVKKHSALIAPSSVAMVRGSTVLGKGHNATITLVSGLEVPVAETKKAVLAALGVRVKKVASR